VAFVGLRPLLFSIAYQMTGSVVDAEDIVSESYVRLHRALAEKRQIRNLKQYLTTAVTRLSIDHLRATHVRRESYVGPWLPEPLVDASTVVDFERIELADTLSMAFLVLLESLSPAERAVFLLREVFEFEYSEIAGIIEKSEANCRQLLRRAKHRVELGKPRFDVDAADRDELAARFFAAIQAGDLEPLVTMLAEDVVVYGDGGGNGPSLPKPIFGRQKALGLLAGLAQTVTAMDLRIDRRPVNGQPGALVRTSDGELVNVLAIDVTGNLVQTVRSVINPEKLQHLAPLADVAALGRTARRTRRSAR